MVSTRILQYLQHSLKRSDGLVLGYRRNDDSVCPVKSGETFVERWRCVDQLDIGLERQRLVVRTECQTSGKHTVPASQIADDIG
jgi:hypothetical protein